MTALVVEQHYSPRETGGLLKIATPTVRKLDRAGKLRGIRIAGRLRFSASAINEYLARCANAPRRARPAGLVEHGGRPKKKREAQR